MVGRKSSGWLHRMQSHFGQFRWNGMTALNREKALCAWACVCVCPAPAVETIWQNESINLWELRAIDSQFENFQFMRN